MNKKYQILLDTVMETAPVCWDDLVKEWSAKDRNEPYAAVKDLDDMIQTLTRFRGYIEHHAQSHAAGVKASNTLANRVRKILGFQHKADIRF